MKPVEEARPSDRRDGQKIADTAEIAFTTEDDSVVVSVGATPMSGGRTVHFRLEDDDTSWSCTCTAAASPWCKHVVAAVLAADKV